MLANWVSAEHRPPQWVPRDGAVSVNRYADVSMLLRHPGICVPELGRNIEKLAERANRSFPNLVDFVGGFLLFHNPPKHTRLRQFLRQSLELLGPALGDETIRGHVSALLDEVSVAAPVDAAALANRLPIRVMARALGLPETLVVSTRETNYGLNRVWHYASPLRVLERLEVQAAELFAPMLERLRADTDAAPGLRAIASLGREQFDLTDQEIAASAFFLILAGIVTTSGMLGSAIFLALSHPAGSWWHGSPQAVKTGLDEVLRMTTPLRELVRLAGADIDIGDTVIKSGTSVILKLEEANWDPAVYTEPNRFDPTRRGLPHLAFAAGAHACLGVALAHREAAILLEQLFERFNVELLDCSPHWGDDRDFRRLKNLPVILRLPSNGKAT